MSADVAQQAGGVAEASDRWLQRVAASGEMGARVAAFDWESTPLGALAGWPEPLRGMVMLCVGSLFPMTLRVGEDQLIVYNDACRTVYGPERFADALGRPSGEVWPETKEQLGAILDRVISTGRPYFAKDRLVWLDRTVAGEECYFTFCYNPVTGDDNTTQGVLATFVETTVAQLAQRRLATVATLERRLAGLWSEDELGRAAVEVLAGNCADHPAGALYRVPRDGGVPEPIASFGDALDAGAVGALVEACLAEGVSQHESSGRVHAFPVPDPEDPTPTHVLVIAQHRARPWDAELNTYLDLLAGSLGAALVTQSELRSQQRRAARAEALEAAKSAFFMGVSHDLRTPLSLIAGPVDDLLERAPDLAPWMRQDLALVQHNAARLARLVDAMLDFARIDAGRVVPDLQPSDVSVLVAGLAASFAPAIERAGLRFAVDVPPVTRPALIDEAILERIVGNLLSNALKFTTEGSVSLRLVEVGEAYEVTVSDTGIGIAPADHDRVFDRFERLAPRAGSRAVVGAGIGLAMVRQLAQLLEGSVRLESAPGRGSTFTVRLPFSPPHPVGVNGHSITPRRVDSFLAELAPPVPDAAASGNVTAPRLLVVEDDAQLAGFLSQALCDCYRVEVAEDGASALDTIRRERPDIVLSDVSMPTMDGLQLVSAIRADPAMRDLPVVLLTARANEKASAAGLAHGADDYIAKPFAMSDLRARLAAHLERARERNTDAAWRQAVLTTIPDGVLVFDGDGLVLDMNQAFTDMIGYSLADGPIRPPYPWWPTDEEDRQERERISAAHEAARQGQTWTHELCFYRSDRRPVWVQTTDATIGDNGTGLTACVRSVRDISRERAARERRAAAARAAADFAAADDLETLLGAAEHGFAVLFGGGSTVGLGAGGDRELLISGGVPVAVNELPPAVRAGLEGAPVPDPGSLRDGILLEPPASRYGCRAWIQFPRPRRVGQDEMIVADLLAHGFGLAVDRILFAEQAANREDNLHVAIESHRMIGQAVGILVERHHLTPAQAFQRLSAGSQNRNIKLRELARRVIETGVEPEDA